MSFDWSHYRGNLDWLPARTLYLVRHGSHAYGTNLPDSDEDFKGVCIPPAKCFAAREVPINAQIVEVGVCAGRSAAYLGVELINAGKIGARLHLVDNNYDHKGIEGIRAALAPIASVLGNIHMGDSWSFASHYTDRSLDFVYLDAGHEFENISRDIDAWLPKMKHGAIFGGHDFTDEIPGVVEAVCEKFKSFAVDPGSQWENGRRYPSWWLRV